jgi:hypothetical protein
MAHAPQRFPARNSPRPPTEHELAEVWAWMKEQRYDEMYLLEEASWFEQFWIAVFDHYITGSPGYAGKVLYLIWDGTPANCTVFVWNKANIVLYAEYAQ